MITHTYQVHHSPPYNRTVFIDVCMSSVWNKQVPSTYFTKLTHLQPWIAHYNCTASELYLTCNRQLKPFFGTMNSVRLMTGSYNDAGYPSVTDKQTCFVILYSSVCTGAQGDYGYNLLKHLVVIYCSCSINREAKYYL